MPAADLYEIAEEYRPEFPVFRSATYLNSCSLGALSERARSALSDFLDLWGRWGASAWHEHWVPAAQDVRSAFARLIGADDTETALAPSVSAALSTVASGIDFRRRPKVVTTELDFPTVVYQFLARRGIGVEPVVLESPDGVSVPLEAFAEAVDERTALVATSHVYYTSGAIQDIGALARIAHEQGALCLIDAYQSTGQLPVNARALDVDILLSGALKWLLGGQGLAFAYVRQELVRTLTPTAVGWFGVEDQFAFATGELRLRPDARRFELGTPAVPTIYAARAGLELVEEVGVERIRRRISSLTEDLIARAQAAGFTVRGAAEPEARSGIVMIEHPDPAQAVRRLMAAGVICDCRPGAVRLSPHFYNTTDDNEKAMGVLAGKIDRPAGRAI
ncbi:MAG: aminotransferase class V-fold PLP-dependent enzyme [Gemmatimonadota bacterium]